MDRVAVFVDAGYLYAGGAKSVSGNDGVKRHDIALNIPVVIPYLIKQAEAISQQKILRIYWYDAAPSGRPNTDHQILASTDNVKLRLGVINGFGQQKGVDGRIITDLTELSRNRAFADAVLLGGDEDFRLGVELAQEYGTRIHLLTIEGSSSSPTLRQESDTMTIVAREDLQTFISVRAASTMMQNPTLPLLMESSLQPTNHGGPQNSSRMSVARLAAVAESEQSLSVAVDFDSIMHAEITRYLASLSPAEQISLTAALKTGAGVPAEHDGQLLARTRNALGRTLTQPEKVRLRRALKNQLGS